MTPKIRMHKYVLLQVAGRPLAGHGMKEEIKQTLQ